MKLDEETREEWIRLRAYLLWEADGCPEGRAEFYWHRARRVLEEESPNEKSAEAAVDAQIDDSFPASDPPSYNAGGRLGAPPKRATKAR